MPNWAHCAAVARSSTKSVFAAFLELGHEVKAAFAADPFGYPFPLPVGIEAVPIRGLWSRSFGDGLLAAGNRRLAGFRFCSKAGNAFRRRSVRVPCIGKPHVPTTNQSSPRAART